MTDNATPSFCVVPGGRRPDRDPIPHQQAQWSVEMRVDPGSDGRGDDGEAFGKTSKMTSYLDRAGAKA